jgi:hypothetical protein
MEISGIQSAHTIVIDCMNPLQEAALFVKLRDGNAASFTFTLQSSVVGSLDHHISAIKKIIYPFTGQIHQPELFRLANSKNICVCTCTGFEIQYNAFEKNGTPLVAEITMTVMPKYFEASSKLHG